MQDTRPGVGVRKARRSQGEGDLFTALLDTLGALVVVLDTQGRIVRFNQACQRATGYLFAEVEGRPFWDFLLLPQEAEAVKKVFARLNAGHFPNQHENHWLAKDGSQRLIAWSNTAVCAADGMVELVIGTGIDVTERRQAEAERERLLAQVIREREFAERLAETLERERDTLQAIMENTRTQVAYLDRGLNFVRVNSAYAQGCGHPQEELLGRNHFELFPNPENQAIFERVRDTGQPVEYHAKPFEYADQPERGVTYWDWSLAPVKDQTGVVQGLVLSLVDVTHQILSAQEREQLLADNLSQREFLERLIEAAPVGIAVVSGPDHRYELVNSRYQAIVGVSDESILGRPISESLDSTASADADRMLKQVFKTGRTAGVREYEARTGPEKTLSYWNVDQVPLRGAGAQVERAIILAHEVTDEVLARRRAEEASTEAQRRLDEMDAVYAAMSDAVIVYDAQGVPVKANVAAREVFGMELVGADREGLRKSLQARHEDGSDMAFNELPVTRALRGQRVTDLRVVIQDDKGDIRKMRASAAPLLAGGKITGAVAILHDITLRGRAEDAMRESERKLRELIELLPIGVSVLDEQRKVTKANPALSDILGLSIEQLMSGAAGQRRYIRADGSPFPPDEFPSVRAHNEQRLISDVEIGVIKDNAETVWTSVSAAPLPFADWRVLVATSDITPRKSAEQALRHERDFVSAVLDTGGNQVIVLDRLGRIVRYNRAGERATGYSLEEVQGKPFWELFVEPQEVESARSAFAERQAAEIPTTYEGNWVAKDGSKRWIVWSITALADERGMAEYIIGSGTDLTERRAIELERTRALEDSQRRETQLAALLGGARGILERDSLQDNARSVIQACQDLTGAMEGYVAFAPKYRADTQGILLVRGTESGTVDPALSQPIQALHGEVYRTGGAVCENAFRSSQWSQLSPDDAACADSLLVTPVVLSGEVVGLLGMANKPGGFGTDDARVGTAFAELVAIALHKSQLRESLRASEQRFRSVVETASAAIVTADSRGHITFWNRMAERVFGYAAQEAMDAPLTLIMPERFRAAHQTAMQRVLNTGKSRLAGETLETVGVRKGGQEFPIEMSLATWKVGEGMFFTGIMQDATRRKQAEAALREALQSFETLFKASPLAIIAFDGNKSIRLWNPAAERIFGWSEAEVLGRPNPIVPADKQPELQKILSSALEGKPLSVQKTVRQRKDGTRIDVDLWSAPLYDAEGQAHSVMVALADITERKRADEKLQQYARQQASLYTVASAVSATLDRDQLFPVVLEAVLRALEADVGWVLMPYPSPSDPARIVAQRGTLEGFGALETVLAREDCPVYQSLFRKGNGSAEGLVITDCPLLTAKASPGLGSSSLACVPLLVGNQMLGVMKIGWRQQRPDLQSDRALLLAIGRQVGVALHNAQLFQSARQLDRLQALSDLDRALAATFDLRKLAEETMQRVRQYLNVPAAAIFLLPPAGEVGPVQEMFTSAGVWEEVKIDDRDLVRWQAFLGRLTNEPEPVDFGPEEFGLASHDSDLVRQWQRDAIVVPIRGERSFLALLALGGRGPDRALMEEDRALAAVAASHAGQAMQNAQLYQELRGLLAERERARAQLLQSEKLAALGRLAASIAHEINNPLQAIENSLTLVHEELDGNQRRDKLERYLGIVGGEVGRISGIVRQMRDYYRPAHERLLPTDVRAVLDSVLELSNKELQHHGITVERLDAQQLPQVQANPAHLKQVFLNLVLNAIEAMPDGGKIRVRTHLDRAKLEGTEQPQPLIRIEVSDTGRGMSAETKAHLFEPFFTTKAQGAGLGLYVTYSIVEAHHGQILVDSQPGAGTTFTILLPVTRP